MYFIMITFLCLECVAAVWFGMFFCNDLNIPKTDVTSSAALQVYLPTTKRKREGLRVCLHLLQAPHDFCALKVSLCAVFITARQSQMAASSSARLIFTGLANVPAKFWVQGSGKFENSSVRRLSSIDGYTSHTGAHVGIVADFPSDVSYDTSSTTYFFLLLSVRKS